MKKGWLAGGLLLLLVGLALWNVWTLGNLTEEAWNTLAQAEAQAEQGNWEEAGRLTEQARERWEAHSFYLHVTLQHKVIDEVQTGFAEVGEFIQNREAGEYSAANARLMNQLALMGEAERPTLENLL